MNDLISRAQIKHERDLVLDQARKAMPCTGEDEELDHGARMYRAGVQDLARRLLVLPAASQPEAEPVAWRWRWNGGDEPDIWAYREDPIGSNQHRTIQPLYAHPTPAPVVTAEGLDMLIAAAKAEAEKAMRKFPQPNYVISKVAEEAGEVVKAAIHCAEGRETQENVVSEIRQAMAMLFRLYLEGDQVHGLPPLRAQQPAVPVSGVTVQETEYHRIGNTLADWAGEVSELVQERRDRLNEDDLGDARLLRLVDTFAEHGWRGLKPALSALEGK